MLKELKKRTQGFTIIEVMIVLAIAGLILLIIFLAVPALQRNSRNTQRKNDVSALLGGLTEYSNNNNGSLPDDWDAATNSGAPGWHKTGATQDTQVKVGYYTPAQVVWPATRPTAQVTTTGSTTSNVYVYDFAKCNTTGSGALAGTTGTGSATATARSIAVVYWIDTASGTQQVCQDN